MLLQNSVKHQGQSYTIDKIRLWLMDVPEKHGVNGEGLKIILNFEFKH